MRLMPFRKVYFYTAFFVLAVLAFISVEALGDFTFVSLHKFTSKFGFIKTKNETPVGSLKGSFAVTPAGQAHYSIPIKVPSGTNKMQPALAITYDSTSSNTRNGLLGMGFSLEGLTAITRCSSDKSRNGEIHGVDFTDKDCFCLSGQQLVALKGKYGQDQTEYRTYHDTQTRIISHGRQGNGPAYFTVETKGGQTVIYGATNDSQNKAQGTDTVAIWGLSRIKDSLTNYLDVKYFKDEKKGIFYPIEIKYTGNEKTGMKPYNSVEMSYESRPDVNVKYQSGSKVTLNKLLDGIQVFQAGKLVHEYKLKYQISPNTSRSRMNSIQKCDGNGNCLPATTFDWQTNDAGWEEIDHELPGYITYYRGDLGKNSDNGLQFIDLNGDGLVDVAQSIWWKVNGHKSDAWLATRSGAKWRDVTSIYKLPDLSAYYNYGKSKASDNGFRFIDVTGNGLSDIVRAVYWNSGDLRRNVWLNNGVGWQESATYTFPGFIAYYRGDSNFDNGDNGVQFIDLTGNGLTDIVQSIWWDINKHQSKAWLNSGSNWDDATDVYKLPDLISYYNWGKGKASDNGLRFMDVNGDGLVDIVRSVYWNKGDVRSDVWLNTGSGWQESKTFKSPDFIVNYRGGSDHSNGDNGLQFIDLNGDGLPDAIQSIWWDINKHKSKAWINTGKEWIDATDQYKSPDLMSYYSNGVGKASDNGLRFVDLNGDGLPDIVRSVYWNLGDQRNNAWINTAGGWKEDNRYKSPAFITYYRGKTDTVNGDNGVRFIDINGNGLVDVVQSIKWKHGNKNKIWLNKAKKLPDYLIGITDGLGAKTKIDYEPLSGDQIKVYDQELNSDGTLASEYPNPQEVMPMYVVYQTASETHINDPLAKAKFKDGKGSARTFPQSPYSTVPSNLDGSQHLTTYHYSGARTNKLGFGFLGFHKLTITDSITGISKTTTYSQDPTKHSIGKELFTETHANDGTLIHSTENEWGLKTFGDGAPNNTRYLPFVKKATEKGYSLDGKLITVKTINMNFDDYANPTSNTAIVIDAAKGYQHITSTINTYKSTVDDKNWIPGQLIKSQVTASALGVPDETHASSFVYDNNGLLRSETVEPKDSKLRSTKIYTRDDFGNIIKTEVTNVDKSIKRITSSKYDPKGRFQVKVTDAMGQTTSQTMDFRFGKPLTKVDINGLVTAYAYDSFGRSKSQINPDNTKISNESYWVTNPIEEVKDAVYVEHNQVTGRPDAYQYYDRLNRKVAKCTQGFDGRNVWEITQYDELDRITATTNPYFEGDKKYYSYHEYDVLGRVSKSTRSDGVVIKVFYDGLTTKTINPLGQITTKVTDVRGNIIKSIDNSGHAVMFKHDAFGRLIEMKDSKGNITTMTYNKLGHKLTQNDPDKGLWKYEYNVLGEMLKQIDAKGNVTEFKYDDLGRVILRKDEKGSSAWEYGSSKKHHNVGLLIKEYGVASVALAKNGMDKINKANAIEVMRAGQNGIKSYIKKITYDHYARPSTTTVFIDEADFIDNYTTKVEYDDLGRVWKTTYPNGIAIENIYNQLGYLEKVKNSLKNGTVYWQLNSMDASGRNTMETHSNGLVTKRTYDPANGFLKEIYTSKGANLLLQQKILGIEDPSIDVQKIIYEYDHLGQPVKRFDRIDNIEEKFDYDNLNRLTNWNATGGLTKSKRYEYDELGNITYQSGLGHYIYDKSAGPHAVAKIINDHDKLVGKFEYDNVGNQIEASLEGESRRIQYTSYGKPLVIYGEAKKVEFYYDADRNQFIRVDQAKHEFLNINITTKTLSLGAYVIEKRWRGPLAGVREKIYVGPYTEIIAERKKDSLKTYVHELLKDSLGSLTKLTDSDGKVLQSYHYEPFGKQITLKDDIPFDQLTHQGFAGHQEIEPFGLIHMGGRIYDPIIARFLTADPYIQDPTNTQSLNRYSYCLNSPLAYTDPTGYGWFSDLIHGIEKLIHEIGHALESIFKNHMLQIVLEIALQFVPVLNGIDLVVFDAWYSAFNTALSGGSLGDVFKAALIGAAEAEIGELTGGLDKAAFGTTKFMESVVINGLEGGGIKVIQGGSFVNGFVNGAAARVVKAIAPNKNKDLSFEKILMRTAISSITAGAVAAVNGGNYMKAAESAALNYLKAELKLKYHTQIHELENEFHSILHELTVKAFGPLNSVPLVHHYLNNSVHKSEALDNSSSAKTGHHDHHGWLSFKFKHHLFNFKHFSVKFNPNFSLALSVDFGQLFGSGNKKADFGGFNLGITESSANLSWLRYANGMEL